MSSMPPSTAEYVRFHAQHRPRAIAVIDGEREIEYATFDRDLRKSTRALREFGLPRGSVVAVSCEALYLHWLLLLACENLGWATVSLLATEGSGPLFDHVQLVLSEREIPQTTRVKRHLLAGEWLAKVFSSSAPGQEEYGTFEAMAPTEPKRLRRTSGTTGDPKIMIATHGYEEERVRTHLIG
jgi:acyl-coenzyme A synthetase/AMP-(fatty) acid ligase